MQDTDCNRRTFLRVAGGACAAVAMSASVESAAPAAPPNDLPAATLGEASELRRTKKVSPKELTAACVARIERLNPILNAFITVTAEQAMAEAAPAEADIMKGRWRGPLHGIPVGLKDLIETASVRTTGPLTRTVLDATMLLQAIAGYDALDTTSVDRPVPAFIASIKRRPSSVRVGVPRESFFAGLHADVQAAVEDALDALTRLTAGLHEVVVPVSPETQLDVLLAEGFAFHADRIRETPQLFQPPVLGRLQGGEAVGTATYINRRRQLDQLRRMAPELFTRVDLLVTPTVPLLPIPIAEALDDEKGTALYARNTRPFNAYGLPAVSVPCGIAKDGLPIGLQVIGPPWGEESVLRLAHAFEQTTDAGRRRPVM